MHKIHLTGTISEDRRLVVTLPEEVPSGPVEIELTIPGPQLGTPNGAAPTVGNDDEEPFFSLAAWFEKHSEHWGDRIRSDDVEGFTGRRY